MGARCGECHQGYSVPKTQQGSCKYELTDTVTACKTYTSSNQTKFLHGGKGKHEVTPLAKDLAIDILLLLGNSVFDS